MSFLGRKKPKDDKQAEAPPMIDPNTGLPPPYDPPDPSNAKGKDEPKAGIVTRIRNYALDSYNGLYKIVLEPSMPKRSTIAVLVVGVIIGMISAYLVFPTILTGAGPRSMSDDAIEQWVRMVAVGHAEEITYPDQAALDVLQQLPNPQEVTARVANNPNLPDYEQDAVAELQQIPGFESLTGTVPPQDPGLVGSIMQIVIPILLVAIITPILVLLWRLLIYPNIVAGIMDAIKQATNSEYREQKKQQQEALKRERQIREAKLEMQKNVVADAEYGEPVMKTLSIYTKGRNYDDSFAIELGPEHGNQFLGECGASIATTVGEDMQSVEFWLFDMATQDTLTKIFAAPAAVNDPTLQAKLGPRVKNPATDIIPAQVGSTLSIDTDALRIQGKISSIEFSSAGGAPNTAIENMQMEITAWQKQGTPAGLPVGGPPPIPPPQPLPDYDNIQFDPPPQAPSSSPPPGGRSMDDYADIEFDPPPQMPSSSPPGSRSMDDYADIEFDPPPQMPSGNPLKPPPLQMPPSGVNPLQPPPLQMPQSGLDDDDEDDDPFGGTGDFTPLS